MLGEIGFPVKKRRLGILEGEGGRDEEEVKKKKKYSPFDSLPTG